MHQFDLSYNFINLVLDYIYSSIYISIAAALTLSIKFFIEKVRMQNKWKKS